QTLSSGTLNGGSTTDGAIQNLSYVYDRLGNVMTRTDLSGSATAIGETSTYDILQRLVTQQNGSNGTTLSNSYASLGNITANTETSLRYGETPSCNGNGEIPTPGAGAVTSTGSGTTATSYCYDSHGNQTRTLGSQGTSRQQTYTSYDALREVVLSATPHAT